MERTGVNELGGDQGGRREVREKHVRRENQGNARISYKSVGRCRKKTV